MLNYNHLYYFHLAATAGSLAGAAEQLGVSQPTVSEQVRHLERRLRVPLFERSNEGLRLTGPGRLVYQHTTVMFREAERMLDELGFSNPSPAKVRVGVTVGINACIGHTIVPKLLHRQDRVVCLRTGALADLYRDLRSQELDLLLCATEPAGAADAGLSIRHLDRRPELIGIAPAALELRDAWYEVPLVQYSELSPYRADVERYLHERQLYPRVVAETDDPSVMVDTAMHGMAIAFVPAAFAHHPIATGYLRRIGAIESVGSDVVAVYRPTVGEDLAQDLLA